MKKLLVMCGSGIATSTVVMGKVKTWLEENGYDKDVKLYQSKIAEEVNHIDDYDIVISTTVVPESVQDKVIMGLPLLTGIGADALWEEVKKEIEA
ncbi:PTS system galactitol-specific transporter subunit IIB [Streptococcus pseudoporcinus]|uniref:PTS sugar transporter subunit IIB n=3 Tax=Streptococcus TaxID=1301 RepID=A0A4V0H202_STRPO|nr:MULTISPECIES: PTS sugar transporter subunit IIB [Streptococcus]EGJ26478.1 PTS system protein galactitol-specific enzyme IIB component family protein [Streptococcus porcinus str. Jelinkova 176]MBA2795623.1 PTS sugar transporter subunit IIB [Streptococcus porcinus]SQG42527.1 PTS system galactitol-specific transporter subunit IIB [Streptococcus porcinus]VTS16387.1 PTS system galactitol-specific transporter subunit IIB [Streptococcus porcinus]VTS41521.1 PTS system galactitol-specific transporte